LNHHFAIYISNKDNKNQIIDRIQSGVPFEQLLGLRGALFSEITINKFIEEERIHGVSKVTPYTKNSLQHSSEGERKKSLLSYIIAHKPEYIILDNVFGNLDAHSQAEIQNILEALSKEMLLVQIANRKQDILPFIEKVYEPKDNQLVLLNSFDVSTHTYGVFIKSLPIPYKPIDGQYNPIVKFNKVSVTYGDRGILKDICWEIKQGEFWQLNGPNGSGKSTILSMIFGDNPKAYGQDIILFGVKKGSGESVWDIKRKIGYFSSEMLRGFKRLDSIGNMVVSGFFDSIGLYQTPTNQQIIIAHQWLHVLDMFDIRKKDFLSLSKGHQSLVLIARAMVKQPPLLILDEPTNGLDDHDAALFSQLINKISLETNTAILYVSHRKEEKLLKPDFVYELVPNETGSLGKQEEVV